MYTSYGDANTPTAEPSATASAAPNTPAMPFKTNPNTDHMTPLPPRMTQPPTSSPSIQAQQQPSNIHGSPTAAGATPGSLHPAPSWPIEGIEPRIYPGMISRRQRAGSMRKSSTHESDERASARTAVGAVEEADAEENE